MATYHLRVKDDTKTSGTRVSAKRHVDYILREEGKAHADYINREGAQRNKDDCVWQVIYRSGLKTRLKNFLVRRLVTKIKETSAIEK